MQKKCIFSPTPVDKEFNDSDPNLSDKERTLLEKLYDKLERQINRLSHLKFYSKLPDEFVPAKTLKEANAYVEKYFNLRCSYKGIDVRIANEWNRGVYDMKKEIPEVADKLKFIYTGQERNGDRFEY